MRFLIVTRLQHPIHTQQAPALMDAMTAWRQRHANHIEHIWAFAGLPGGAGVANVDSLEELDAAMAEFPLLPFSHVEVYPLVDFEGAQQRARQAMEMMAGGT